ncbi:RdgB/HAM1 family non-canonical purine NTP pyrophosphatase [Christensenellaceae bacterium NSJ-63]|uniref:dITP/XTP pyrophosphatase n=1 Tax=Guopingia tenuis TaxID=2763656 RepID=A0A926DJF5_9FIRM|nr:RdgB/HAM1 family non-canonical purine NTP pyrophosphatase [Guopingia tenuis]MBC8539158.1 RdgB/HAM1 family non-canonical purine NTP pyrophosphatase [Guopingia tenuis]
MKKLVIATGNPGKVREIKKILEGVYDEICSLKDEGIAVDIVEDADSFLGNAAKKALTISRLVDCDVLADDSGLCVDGLGGRPGVYSARYSASGTDEDNNKKLVEECAALDEEGRQASYVCAIVLARGGQEIYSCEGKCYGRIVLEAHGNGGFGYDPYFYLPEYGQTFGELPAEEKNKISHRALALKKVQEFLQK